VGRRARPNFVAARATLSAPRGSSDTSHAATPQLSASPVQPRAHFSYIFRAHDNSRDEPFATSAWPTVVGHWPHESCARTNSLRLRDHDHASHSARDCSDLIADVSKLRDHVVISATETQTAFAQTHTVRCCDTSDGWLPRCQRQRVVPYKYEDMISYWNLDAGCRCVV